jgi:outer membrane protein insertion porin family
MATKQARFTRLFSSGTSYDPDRMAYDQQKMRQFYLTQGYADFRVVSAVAELTPDKQDFIITYVVEEGQRYKFGDVEGGERHPGSFKRAADLHAADAQGRLV